MNKLPRYELDYSESQHIDESRRWSLVSDEGWTKVEAEAARARQSAANELVEVMAKFNRNWTGITATQAADAMEMFFVKAVRIMKGTDE